MAMFRLPRHPESLAGDPLAGRAKPVSALVDDRFQVVSASDPALVGTSFTSFGDDAPVHGSAVLIDGTRIARCFRLDGAVGISLVIVEPAGRARLSRDRLVARGLTPRESDVALVLVTGASDAAIAKRLHVGEATVRTHLRSLIRKLGARARSDAIARLLA